jgi:hypothetical protein
MKNGIPGKLVAQLKIKIYWCSICSGFENKLYVLDTRSPLFGAVLDAPRLLILISMRENLHYKSSYPNSYINDLRVIKNNKIYCTDSGRAGLIVLI